MLTNLETEAITASLKSVILGLFKVKLTWVLLNKGDEIKESHDFETDLNFKKDLIGNLKRISKMISCGNCLAKTVDISSIFLM